MNTSSFDIFDTCLVRKCGTSDNFFDVLSLHVFNENVEEWIRQEFVAARRLAERNLSEFNPYYTLHDIWIEFDWSHQFLKSKDELYRLEQEMEREMLVPVLKVRDKVNECRNRGDKLIFISDMYLPSEFLISVMREFGFYLDGDSLYVSCECHATKMDGGLFRYVREMEGIRSQSCWCHYGDNIVGDYKTPRKLGIRCTLINHQYTPYQKRWVSNDYSLGFKYPSVIAGIGRALHYSTKWNTHTDFVLDIIAPFYCSLVFRMMNDADKQGIKRLYFCARDAYIMYKIALQYKDLFPKIECVFLYISRKALYDGDDLAKITYYEQMGLATKDDFVGIVDIRSSGRSLYYLNKYLTEKGFKNIRGYYYELFCGGVSVASTYAPLNYYIELSDNYLPKLGKVIGGLFHILENFFPLNNISRTVDYLISDGIAKPVFGSDDNTMDIENVYIENKEKWANLHEKLIVDYSLSYVACGLCSYSENVFKMANDTLFLFMKDPCVFYLPALECLYGKRYGQSEFLPYVKKESWLKLLFTRGKDTLWKQATIKYNKFDWAQNIYRKLL